MDINDYSWNQHERKLKLEDGFISTDPKIKIEDDWKLRGKLEQALEELPHAQLAQWTLANAEPFLVYLDEPFQKDQRIIIAKKSVPPKTRWRSFCPFPEKCWLSR